MAEGSTQLRYVRLTKEQTPTEDITPGELNQPIDVPQVSSFFLLDFTNHVRFCFIWCVL